MNIVQTFFDCVHLIETPRYHDERGWFTESLHQQNYSKLLGIPEPIFVQSNISHSHRNVLRGLHAQLQQPQGKLIQVLQGKVYDVFVDIRTSSKTYGHWHAVVLDALKNQQLWLPPGFAHGFLTLENNTTMLYHCSDYYAPNDQITVIWNDENINIDWPLNSSPIISAKDQTGMTLKELEKCVF